MSELQFSHERVAPDYIVAGLRAVDPDMEIVWWGPLSRTVEKLDQRRPWRRIRTVEEFPTWLVGSLRTQHVLNHAASCSIRLLRDMTVPRDAAPLLKREYRNRWRLANLRYQGFRPTFMWPFGDLDWSVVTEVERLGWFARHMFEIVQKQQLRTLDKIEEQEGYLTDKQRVMQEYVSAAMPDIWRHVFAGRRSILVPKPEIFINAA